jgi:hypothetical protein
MKKKKPARSLDLGPLETVEDCQEALRRIARACAAGEGDGDALVRASEVIENMLRVKFLEASVALSESEPCGSIDWPGADAERGARWLEPLRPWSPHPKRSRAGLYGTARGALKR